MAKITKKVDRNIPFKLRSQQFTKDEISEGDVLMIEDSLGFCANHVEIKTASGAMAIRLNVYQTVYPKRPANEGMNAEFWDLIASGIEYKTETPRIEVATNTTLTVNGFAVRDLEVITASGIDYSILVR